MPIRRPYISDEHLYHFMASVQCSAFVVHLRDSLLPYRYTVNYHVHKQWLYPSIQVGFIKYLYPSKLIGIEWIALLVYPSGLVGFRFYNLVIYYVLIGSCR